MATSSDPSTVAGLIAILSQHPRDREVRVLVNEAATVEISGSTVDRREERAVLLLRVRIGEER